MPVTTANTRTLPQARLVTLFEGLVERSGWMEKCQAWFLKPIAGGVS